MGTPIINLPQTGIDSSCFLLESHADKYLAVLGLHAIKEKPVAIDGKVEIRPVCSSFPGSMNHKLTLSSSR